jgi:hypothetical protein
MNYRPPTLSRLARLAVGEMEERYKKQAEAERWYRAVTGGADWGAQPGERVAGIPQQWNDRSLHSRGTDHDGPRTVGHSHGIARARSNAYTHSVNDAHRILRSAGFQAGDLGYTKRKTQAQRMAQIKHQREAILDRDADRVRREVREDIPS